MIFTHPRKNPPPPSVLLSAPSRNNSFSARYLNQILTRDISTPVPSPPPPPPVDPAKKPMKWGEPTWFLFHTISEKIKPEFFNEYKDELVELIKSICSTLPCPDCRAHATEYISKINFNQIRNKTDLQYMFWTFHNVINQRKGFPIFPSENLSEKYSKAITRNIIQEFIRHHEDKNPSFKMIADDFYRKKITNNIKMWFIKNIEIFEP